MRRALSVVDVDAGRTAAKLPAGPDMIAISSDGRMTAVVGEGRVSAYDLPPRKPGGVILGLMIAEVAIARTAWRRRFFRRRVAVTSH